MDPIAKTAYYCCGVRAVDAASTRPVCGDGLAERFMEGEGREVFARFAHFHGPNASNAARHRVVDDLLYERLRVHPRQLVVLLGAGFDTRAFRLPGGRWVELDQAALLALKEERLPAADAPNALQRVTIDFAHERLADKLSPWHGNRHAVVVMEGVSMYLDDGQFADTASTLRAVLPGHTLICDLMSARFARLYSASLRREIVALGGDFAAPREEPGRFVASLGYRELAAQSVVGAAVDHGALPLPRWLLDSFFRSMRDGYRVHVFESPL